METRGDGLAKASDGERTVLARIDEAPIWQSLIRAGISQTKCCPSPLAAELLLIRLPSKGSGTRRGCTT